MSGLKIEPDDFVKKEARGLQNADLGEVQSFEKGLIVTKKGLVKGHTYYFPKVLVDRFDGKTLYLRVAEADLEKYEKN
jgi:hypothetical protein